MNNTPEINLSLPDLFLCGNAPWY